MTGWPAALARLELAVQTGMIAELSAAFAALATDTTEVLAALRAAHDNTAACGSGWYLACRLAGPAVPARSAISTRTTCASPTTSWSATPRPGTGPVVDAWRRTLTPITDLGQDRDQVRRRRRVHRLLRDDGLEVDRIPTTTTTLAHRKRP